MSKTEHKIEASDKTISELLKDKKFFIDYFQREYRWQKKHMVALVEDLTSTFLKSYKKTDKRSDVANYQSYYLGPVVFSVAEDGKDSIIDGQQRITSITLFLIYLNNLQKDLPNQVSIANLIFSERYGEKSFNMTDEDRQTVLKSLYDTGEFDSSKSTDETEININERYMDIDSVFPETIDDRALPYFIDWFIGNVVIVKITAYSDENAYTIFETMNDRGMNLTSTEMLKGYVLSRISNKKERSEINLIWKNIITELHSYEANADLTFFQGWFRAKYAVSMRPTKAGAQNQDFELVGTRFHSWFKDNHEDLFELRTSDDFYEFFKNQFVFMAKWYMKIWDYMAEFNIACPHLYYINRWGIAPSLQDAMLLATLKHTDKDDVVYDKLDAVARFIETYTVRRAINYRKFGASSIKYTFFNIIKSIRDAELEELKDVLLQEINSLDEKFDGIFNFSMHQQNGKFVKHLLSRITGFIDQEVGKPTNYVSYYEPVGKKFEIEHIWGNKFVEHKDEFEQENDFGHWRNSIGALILLPNGTNQSFSSDKYEEKLKHYIKENTFAQTLHPAFYEKNPNFFNSEKLKGIPFKAHKEFKKADIADRAETVKHICETIWSLEYYNNDNEILDA
ncbi:DUF262 domain-containing protein [Winogradskyella poriferorum]|uniref:DUF262 domain-containing protein n=1 Tax=Winogradskyella poriferorum TaxID=307627 RepID=UPI003D64CE3C